MLNRICPICSQNESAEIYHIQFNTPKDFIIGSEQSIRQCKNCGMVFSDSKKDQQSYSEYYSNSTKYLPGTGQETDAKKERYNNTYLFIKDILKKDMNICDLGCGDGGLLNYLHSRNFINLSGIDPGNLPSTSGFKFIRSNLFDIPRSKLKEFDFISCIGVLEHIYDVPTFMNKISSEMKDQSFLYLEVPSADHYCEKVISPFQDFNLEHINHFSLSLLKEMVKKYGFEPKTSRLIYQYESPAYKMPVISLVSQKKMTSFVSSFSFDRNLKINISKYIIESNYQMTKINQFLEYELNKVEEIYIWGAGQLALKIAGLPIIMKKKVVAFIDIKSSFISINDVAVVKPGTHLRSDIPILIGSILHRKSILTDILEFNLKNKVIDLSYLEKEIN